MITDSPNKETHIMNSGDLADLEYLVRTPGNGDAYYDQENDRAVIVYYNNIKIYTNRIVPISNDNSKFARAFSDCDITSTQEDLRLKL